MEETKQPCNGSKHAQSNGLSLNKDMPSESEPEKKDMAEETGEEEDCTPPPPVAPDGGYGWVIMIASFFCSVIIDGVCFSVGIFYLEFLRHFGESKSKTSLVGSVLNGMYLSMGPISSALASKFGCRAVTMAGSLLSCAAFIISTYSPNIDILIFTYGGLGGAGFGLMYLPAIVMVGFYFEKRRALATGVAVCGSGIGAFVFGPLTEKLISIYGWQGATLIVAGITLNGLVIGGLFRPLEETWCGNKKPCFQKEPTKYNIDKMTDTENKSGVFVISSEEKDVPKLVGYNSDVDWNAGETPGKISYTAIPDEIDKKNETQLRRRRSNASSTTEIAESWKIMSSTLSVYSLTVAMKAEKKKTPFFRGILDSLKDMVDFSLLSNPVFAIYGISCFLCMTGFFVPFMYLPDDAIQKGISRSNAAFLLSIIGIANTIARVLCGWVSDRPWADCLLINNLALIMGGVATILSPFCRSYALLGTYAAIFGSGIAVFVSLRSILMVELIGLDKLTKSFGLVTLCQGLSSFIGSPIAGAIYDATGDYSISFYFAGSTLLLAGLICLPLRRIAAWQKRREDAKQEETLKVQVEDGKLETDQTS